MTQYLVSGIVSGGLYLVAAIGVLMVYRATGVLNFAYGAQAFFIARFYYFLHSQRAWSIWAAAVMSILILAPLLGFSMWVAVGRYLQRATTLVKVAATIGLSVMFPAAAQMIFGNAVIVSAPGLAPVPVASYQVLGVAITADQIAVGICVVGVLAVGFGILRFTEWGMVVRSVVDSPAMTSLTGTNPQYVAVSVWTVTSILAGLTGILLGPVVGLGNEQFQFVIVVALAAVLVARFRSTGATIAAALGIGVASALPEYFLPPSSAITAGVVASIPFAFMFAFLLYETLRGNGATEVLSGGALDRAISFTEVPAGGHHHSSSHQEIRAGAQKVGVLGRGISRRHIRLAPIALLLAAPAVVSPYWAGVLAEGLCFALIFFAFRIITGLGGMIWLCQLSFAGIGAVMTAYLVMSEHWPLGVAIVVAALCALPGGVLIGFLTSRLGELYGALVSLAFGILVDNLVFTLPVFQGLGGSGVVTLTQPSFVSNLQTFFYVMAGVVAVALVLVKHFERSTAGLSLRAVRWSRPASRAMGLNVVATRSIAGGIAALLAAVGGAFVALYSQSAAPAQFDTIGGLVWLAVFVTVGAGSNAAVVVAGIVFAVIPSVIQTYLPVQLALLPQIGFGLGAVMLVRSPDGVLALHRRQIAQLLRLLGQDRSKSHGRVTVQPTSGASPLSTTPTDASSARDTRTIASTDRARTAPLGRRDSGEGEELLRARHISASYGGLAALTNVSISVSPGTMVGLMGPNGAGKSTLFEVLSGFKQPGTGSVVWLGRDVTALSPERRSHLGMARTFQNPELFRSLTVMEHLALAYRLRHIPSRLWGDLATARAWGKPDALEVERIDAIIELLKLERIANRPAAGLPTGSARLVEVGRALATAPRLLLLDEPAAGLDNHASRELAEALRRVVDQGGRSILIIEHDLDFLLEIANLVYVMDAGRIISEGSPAAVKEDPDVRRSYLGDEVVTS
jgi:branched-chain amino acid transport system permease protein